MSKNDSPPAAGESFLLVYHARLPVISAFHRWHGRCNTRSKTTTGGLTMKRNTKIALVMMALSAMAMGSTSAFAHGGHGMWQQNAAPLTSEQQTAWQKIHNDFYAQSSALQQRTSAFPTCISARLRPLTGLIRCIRWSTGAARTNAFRSLRNCGARRRLTRRTKTNFVRC